MKQIFEAYLKLYLNTSEKKNPIESNEEWKIIRKLHYFPSQNAARAVRLLVSSLILGEFSVNYVLQRTFLSLFRGINFLSFQIKYHPKQIPIFISNPILSSKQARRN